MNSHQRSWWFTDGNYDGIFLSEGLTTQQARQDAKELRSARAPKLLDDMFNR